MKRITLLLAGLFLVTTLFAQELHLQIDNLTLQSTALINVEKPPLLKDMNVIANTRFLTNNTFTDGTFTGSNFASDEFRLEIMGSLSKHLSYRFRDLLVNRPLGINSRDFFQSSIDLAFMELKVGSFYIAAGKIGTAWGSYEFDTNPVFIYAFNDFIQYDDHFIGGAQVAWQMCQNHSLTFQVVNSRNQSFDFVYPDAPAGVVAAKAPLGLSLLWRGSFADGIYKPLLSIHQYTEAKSRMAYYVAWGNQLALGNFTLQYDFKFSNQEIDRTGTVRRIIPTASLATTPENIRYMEHWVLARYFISPRWSLMVQGMVNTAYWYGNNLPSVGVERNPMLRNMWGVIGSVEYHPYNFYNVKIFAQYIGRYNTFTPYAREQFGISNFNTAQIRVGILSPLVLF